MIGHSTSARRVLGLGMQPVSRIDEIELLPKASLPHHVSVHGAQRTPRPAHDEADRGSAGQPRLLERSRRDAQVARQHGNRAAALRDVRQLAARATAGSTATRAFAAISGPTPTLIAAAFRSLSFSDDAGFEDYAEYALDVPMYFIIRDHKYVDLTQAARHHLSPIHGARIWQRNARRSRIGAII